MEGRKGFKRCEICMISVPDRQTLETHLNGKDHIKRVKQAEEMQIKERKETRSERYGYQTGPAAMERLTGDEMKQMKELEQNNMNLRRMLKEVEKKRQECSMHHGNLRERQKELEEAQRKKAELVRVVMNLRDECKDLNQPGIKSGKRIKMQTKKEEPGTYTEDTKTGMMKRERAVCGEEEYIEDEKQNVFDTINID